MQEICHHIRFSYGEAHVRGFSIGPHFYEPKLLKKLISDKLKPNFEFFVRHTLYLVGDRINYFH